MFSGVSNCDIMRFKKILANCLAVIDFNIRIYLAIFVYRLTTTKRLLNILFSPFRLGGRSVIKSIIIFFIFRKIERAIIKRRIGDIALPSFFNKLDKF
jgi:phosphate starvation-inducible membrane PsiE